MTEGDASTLFDWQRGARPEYPDVPGHKGGDTSHDAAQRIATHAPRLRTLTLSALNRFGPMTPDECADRLGVDILSIRPRFSELARQGIIEKTGQRRTNKSGAHANVWRAVR